jgi:hypothetical protein
MAASQLTVDQFAAISTSQIQPPWTLRVQSNQLNGAPVSLRSIIAEMSAMEVAVFFQLRSPLIYTLALASLGYTGVAPGETIPLFDQQYIFERTWLSRDDLSQLVTGLATLNLRLVYVSADWRVVGIAGAMGNLGAAGVFFPSNVSLDSAGAVNFVTADASSVLLTVGLAGNGSAVATLGGGGAAAPGTAATGTPPGGAAAGGGLAAASFAWLMQALGPFEAGVAKFAAEAAAGATDLEALAAADAAVLAAATTSLAGKTLVYLGTSSAGLSEEAVASLIIFSVPVSEFLIGAGLGYAGASLLIGVYNYFSGAPAPVDTPTNTAPQTPSGPTPTKTIPPTFGPQPPDIPVELVPYSTGDIALLEYPVGVSSDSDNGAAGLGDPNLQVNPWNAPGTPGRYSSGTGTGGTGTGGTGTGGTDTGGTGLPPVTGTDTGTGDTDTGTDGADTGAAAFVGGTGVGSGEEIGG